jgi:cysteine-rich repeat protein
MIDRGKDRQIYWMYISALSGGCSSENQIAVGANRVSECHMETNDHIAWGSFSIQQESAGWGQYNARLYSHTFRQIVATNSINVTKQLLPGLAPDSGYVMGGGPVECDSTLSSCSTAFGAGPFCGDIKIPTFAGYIDSTLPLRCGDGRAASPSEECDDGNTVNNDGCDSACKVEELSRCLYTFNPGFTFDSETRLYTVSPPDSTCIVPFCGDGVRNMLSEQCDDGNEGETDGCLSTCRSDAGFSCERNISMRKIPGSDRIDEITNKMVYLC